MIEDKLHIVVCVKYTVSSTGGQLGPGAKDAPKALSPFDEYAVEEGVRLKERLEGKAVVTALTVGSAEAEQGLRECVSRGCDAGVLLSDAGFEGSDTYATALILQKAVEKLGKEKGPVDLVVCAKQTNDSDTGQVGPMLAARMGLPSLTAVRKVDSVEPKAGGLLKVHRMMEDGGEVLEATLPAVVSIVKEINEPRIPSLKGKMAARKAEIPSWNAAAVGAEAGQVGGGGSKFSWSPPRGLPPRSGGEAIEGSTPQEKAEKLLKRLKERGLL
jgi:electron transfer flavoprotein beta subunit